ncbi:MAG: hypothetical protein ER33_10370 [Cyanobium sp. CACIAM 14]|nr:MAG: hypothetical protein ER33_10370 [Cyanobium sp. CACIAM 14]
MRIRPAHAWDAGAIAALVHSCGSVLVVDPAAAAPFWAAMAAPAHAANMATSRFRYGVAEADGELVGFVSIRDGSHLFHLFVASPHQGRGIGRALWHHALQELSAARGGGTITVNASLNAVGFYRALGFRQEGEPARVNGVAFVPMLWLPPPGP